MKKQVKAPRPKHIPQRTCVACRRPDAKRGLLRLVRDQAGRVDFDPSGKRAGRGAYLCHNPACWDQVLKRSGLARALRIEVLHPEDIAALQQMAQTLAAPAAAQINGSAG